jgi:hypothetical protein
MAIDGKRKSNPLQVRGGSSFGRGPAASEDASAVMVNPSGGEKKRLLVNWGIYSAVGHLLEGIQNAHGYFAANGDSVEVSLLVNSDMPLTLTEGCPWLANVYGVSFPEVAQKGEAAGSLCVIPREWDYIAQHPELVSARSIAKLASKNISLGQPVLQRHLHASAWSGPALGFLARWDRDYITLPGHPLPFKGNAQLMLEVPSEARAFAARYAHPGRAIAILPVSASGLAQSPSPAAWEAIATALADAFPGVTLYITGITRPNADGRRVGFGFDHEDLQKIAAKVPGVVDCLDIGIWNQIALAERCDVFCSPHTGFAFVSQFVGTPWLTISGCPWREYMFNGVPFYSSLPDCPDYPMSLTGRDRPEMSLWRTDKTVQPACMTDAALSRRLPDIVAGARYLMDTRRTFREACELHILKLKRAGFNPRHFPYVDWTQGTHS